MNHTKDEETVNCGNTKNNRMFRLNLLIARATYMYKQQQRNDINRNVLAATKPFNM